MQFCARGGSGPRQVSTQRFLLQIETVLLWQADSLLAAVRLTSPNARWEAPVVFTIEGMLHTYAARAFLRGGLTLKHFISHKSDLAEQTSGHL